MAPGIIKADSSALARICEGRMVISDGNALNFSGTTAGPNILRISKGHMTRPIRGEMV